MEILSLPIMIISLPLFAIECFAFTVHAASDGCLGLSGEGVVVERIFWLLGFGNSSKGINELDYLMGIPNPQHSLQAMRFSCV